VARDHRSTPLAHACEAPHACPRHLRLDVLANAPYFAGLSGDEIAAIDRRTQVARYAAGETIYRAGTAAEHLFMLASGRVKVLRPSLDGSNVLVDVITPGAMFGSVAALGHSTYPDTSQALTVSCVLRISAADFREVLRQHPAVALAVLDEVSDRLEETQQSVRRHSGGTVEQRVAATLLVPADKLGEPRDGNVLLQLPLTREDLGAMTGTTTESVSCTLSKWRRAGADRDRPPLDLAHDSPPRSPRSPVPTTGQVRTATAKLNRSSSAVRWNRCRRRPASAGRSPGSGLDGGGTDGAGRRPRCRSSRRVTTEYRDAQYHRAG